MNEQSTMARRRANKTALILYGVMNLVLILCYLLEVVKKSRTVGYFIVFCLLAAIPWVISALIYRKAPTSEVIQYTIPGGFSIFYLFIIFTTVSPVAFVYAFIIAIALIPMANMRMNLGYMGIVVIGNIVQVALQAFSGGIASEDLPNIEIRIASSLMVGVYLYVSTKVLISNNQERLEELEEEKQRTADLMEQVLRASDQITCNIGTLSDKMGILEHTTGQTMSAMQEVSTGTNDTAASIQVQMQKTEEIQNTIGNVGAAAEAISEDIQATKVELDRSEAGIRSLIEQVRISNQSNEEMASEMVKLKQYTDQMQTIIDVIDNVTSQTSLLSLNASIEAARAGEAGKGFAVVATEISSLAVQTQQATEDITSLINNISAELAVVVRLIENVISNTKIQNEAANHTADSFCAIFEKIEEVAAQTERTMHLMTDLERANTAITRGIETISAATEEVTAHSSETLSIGEENNKVTGEVGIIINKLHEMAQELSGMTE